ncbi:hypothetical protein LTR42_006155 [Elasticomyces elasticus]|nr:hypothetical protein LTR42_006155 [Elasticomyces elasticus]
MWPPYPPSLDIRRRASFTNGIICGTGQWRPPTQGQHLATSDWATSELLGLYEIMIERQCSANTAARVLARMAESSRDTYEITTDVTNTYVLQVLHAIVKRVLSSGHSISAVAIRLQDGLEQKITADETDWACDTDPHDRILRLFSAFASISHWTQSQFLGGVMRVFFVNNVRTLLSRDTAENVRWASCIEYSWMRPDDKLECLRTIARIDPESVELVRGNAGRRRRGMDINQHSAWDDNMIFNDRTG